MNDWQDLMGRYISADGILLRRNSCSSTVLHTPVTNKKAEPCCGLGFGGRSRGVYLLPRIFISATLLPVPSRAAVEKKRK